MDPIEPYLNSSRVAYFSMEIALRPEIPTYSGGLGVLAGDTLRSAADLGVPMVGVTLISRFGYLRQEIDFQGRQVDHTDPWQPETRATELGAKITVMIEGRQVWVRPWLYVLEGAMGHTIPVILLDTDLPENTAADREITHYLYGGDPTYRFKQEVILGVGGVRVLRTLGFTLRAYHMNEGHSAMLAMELARRWERDASEQKPGELTFHADRVRRNCIFTTHTPVEAGHDRFSYDVVGPVLGDSFELSDLKHVAGQERLNMTCLALHLSGYVNGVAKRHAEVSHGMFPGYRVHAITNGVHPETWTCPSFARLYDRYVPTWRHEPELLVRADQVPAEEIDDAHRLAKRALVELIQAQTGVEMDPHVATLGFARRMTSYKRPELIFFDMKMLSELGQKYPLQIVMAGKAHPRDTEGKRLIEVLHNYMKQLEGTIKIVFLPNYNMELAKYLVSGTDIWLNTPMPPMEASGTSGMKAAFNGVPNLGVLDGWWIEGCIEGVTGWGIGDPGNMLNREQDACVLYDKLRHAVLPLYYDNRADWLEVMKGAISKNAYYFNSHRMMRRYVTDAYNHQQVI